MNLQMMDPAKLKVVELRAELSQRGLDAKGNKPVLIERLRKALEEESGDPKPEEESSAPDTNEEDVAEAAEREAREKTPEPVPPKTPGRSSRSSASSTPSKTASHRSQAKVLLAPLVEKQISPTKSPTVEKQEKRQLETASPEKQPKSSPEKQEKSSPEKQEKSSPEKQEKSSPEMPVKSSPEKPVKSSPEKQEQSSPEKPVKSSPEKQEKSSPEKKEKSSPEKSSPEKKEQSSPEKSSPEKKEKSSPQKVEKTSPEKQGKSSPQKSQVPLSDETKEEEEIPEIATNAQEEAAPEHLEAVDETAKTDTDVAEKNEEMAENVTAEKEEPKSEIISEGAKEPALELEENLRENEKEQEIAPDGDKQQESIEPAADLPEQTEEAPAAVVEKNAEITEKIVKEPEIPENEEPVEETESAEIDEEYKLVEDEAMETSESYDDNKDSSESMEVKQETEEDNKNIPVAMPTSDAATHEELHEEKPHVEVKQEVDEKPNLENELKQSEEDVEMKDVKDEQQDDSDSKDRDRKDRKDRKRKRSSSPQEDRPKSPQPSYKDDEPDLKEADVVLSWYDSDLNLVINRESFLSATAMHSEGFGYIWAGARASFGFTEGKVFFEARITECCEVNLQDEQSPHVLRVGWSVQGTNMQLGEEPLTYGFGGTGKISSGNKFSDYGEAFGKDDVIGCYLDFTDSSNVIMSYAINGKDMGAAFTVPKSSLEGKALFPHILTKNCTFECNFGQEKSWRDEIPEGYVPAGAVDLKERIPGPRRPEKREECEIIMMCGLPAAGKTVWATKYAQDHPDKMYNVLGTNALIEKMKVIGLPRKRNYHGRWEVLINKCTRCLNKLLDLAATRRRNYILDQTNVYPSAQRRKMRNFYGYNRRAVVVVPTEEEFKVRTVKRTACEGEVAPESAVLEMKANFGAPVVGESFDVIEWVELPEEEAKKLIEKYNKEGKEAGFGQQQATSKRPRFESRDNQRESRDSRQSSRDSRDSRDHRDRRNNYPDRNRNTAWRGGSNSGSGGSAWRDRQPRPAGGHMRHGGGGSGAYGSPAGGGWRGHGVTGPPAPYRAVSDRRPAVHDRRTSGSDRNRSVPNRQAGWRPMNSYQNPQQSSGWSGSQSGSWPSSQSGQGSWVGGQQRSWAPSQGQQAQQQWVNWKGYGSQCTYSPQQGSSYSQQGYGNGNWDSPNQQYYNQYWGHQQPTGQTSAAGSQAVSATGSTTAGNSTTSTGSAYSSYSPLYQSYAQTYSFPSESSNTNAQQQK